MQRNLEWLARNGWRYLAVATSLCGCGPENSSSGLADPVLVSVTLTPPAVTLQGGAVQQFAVSGDLSDGSTVTPTVTYSGTGGTVTAGGSYTAGATPGSYRVVAAATGGTADTAVVTIAPPTVTLVRVTLTPSTASLLTGQTRQFAVSGKLSDSSVITPAVNYTATGGSVTSGGLYTAGGSAGTFRVIATQQGGSLADTSTITIALPTLVRVILSPATASLATAGTQQFTVSGKMSDSSTSTPAVNYTATGGTIAIGGLYTAGVTAGTFRVIATQQGGTLADTSAVTISTGSGSPVDTVWSEGFESGTNPWNDEGQSQTHAIVTPPAGAHSGTKAQQVTYPSGADGGWLTRFFMPGYDSIYVRYYIMLESTWQGGTKLSSLYGSRTDNAFSAAGKSGVCPNGTDFFQVTMTGDPTPQMWLRFYDQYFGMPADNQGNCFGSNGNAGTVMTPAQFQLTTGVWHKVEYWMKLNDPALTNSVQEFKIDDVVHGAWTGISVRTSTILKLNAFTLTMSAPNGAPHTQHLWVDDILITRQRPGP